MSRLGAEQAPAARRGISLETTDLSVDFGGNRAVDGVSCSFDTGCLTAIVGPNGAGKTTYFNLISGQIRATSGRVCLHGRDVSRLTAPQRARAGMGRAFQITNLFPALSVQENVRLALQVTHSMGHRIWSVWSDEADLIHQAGDILERVGLGGRGWQSASSLSHGDQRKLEVALLLALEPSVYMFDEPTAGMSVDEVPAILDLILAIKADLSKTVLLVEHKLDVIHALADRIVVLHNGQLVADGTPEEVMTSALVHEVYLGTRPVRDPA